MVHEVACVKTADIHTEPHVVAVGLGTMDGPKLVTLAEMASFLDQGDAFTGGGKSITVIKCTACGAETLSEWSGIPICP